MRHMTRALVPGKTDRRRRLTRAGLSEVWTGGHVAHIVCNGQILETAELGKSGLDPSVLGKHRTQMHDRGGYEAGRPTRYAIFLCSGSLT
jgi:hypothetical protein